MNLTFNFSDCPDGQLEKLKEKLDKIMSAIDELNSAITDLTTTVDEVVVILGTPHTTDDQVKLATSMLTNINQRLKDAAGIQPPPPAE